MTDLASVVLFNSPYECALRTGAILLYAHPARLDLQRLIYMDYLLVHSGDAGGPASLHPAMPQRTAEWTVRRELVKTGLHALSARQLVDVVCGLDGIHYVATEALAPLMRSFKTKYARQVLQSARWVTSAFSTTSEEELSNLMRTNATHWGGEFVFDSQEPDDYAA